MHKDSHFYMIYAFCVHFVKIKFADMKNVRIFAVLFREHSSVGLEHLPYKQRVGGSTPSAPTKIAASYEAAFFVQGGWFGFDSIRHWAVSTPGVGSLPVNLSFRTYSRQQLLCTRCVVCKAHYLNPRRQGCVADEYPSSL